MNDEPLLILRMLSEGKITAEQAEKLLGMLEQDKKPAARPARWFRVRVADMQNKRVRANVRMPIEVIGAVLRMKSAPSAGRPCISITCATACAAQPSRWSRASASRPAASARA